VNLSDPQTLNRYAYVRNNPLTMVDPNGLCDEIDTPTGDNYEFACQLAPTDGGMMGDQGDPTTSGDQSGQDPTSGGNQQNSGGSCAANSSTCFSIVLSTGPPQSGTVAVDGESGNMYMVVTGTTLDVQTESADLGNLVETPPTQLELDCGGCILSQLQNNSDAMSTLQGASSVANGLGYVGVGAAATVVAGPVVVANAAKIVAIITATAILSEFFQSGSGNEQIGPPVDPHDPSKEPREPDQREESAPIEGPPTPP